MSIYYDEINRRAVAKWGNVKEGKPIIEDFQIWKAHWLGVAQDWRQECKEQGLNNTADYITDIIRGNQ
jgi:hypothetical protein